MKKLTIYTIAFGMLLGMLFSLSAAATRLPTIKDLNKDYANGSHADDYYKTASIERNFRETVDLTQDTTGSGRFSNAHYPRVKKVNDNLYLMVYQLGKTGTHLYYATSNDCINWTTKVLYRNDTDASKIVYTEGEHAGEEDRYVPVNPDAVVLDNGEILCAYYMRPGKGYTYASDYNGLYIVRGTVNEKNEIVWGEHKKIYTGQGWEPYIWQRPDGRVEIYWTSIVAYVSMYGFDKDKRSTCTMMIWSDDNGHTWTPKVEAGDKNHYQAYRVYNEYIGDKVPYGTNADGTPMYTEAVPYFGGQMPAATRLYDGRTMLALEVQKLDGSYDFSFAVSEANGYWKELGLLENGPANAKKSIFNAAGPYLASFPSGEVYLTYHWAGRQYYRLGDPKGTEFTNRRWIAASGKGGQWGSSELVSSHEVITAVQIEYAENKYGIQLEHSYLNHRINSKKSTVTVDADITDWKSNTDALFVGSECQAQITVQTAHDDENVYFLITRLDNFLTEGDSASVNIGIAPSIFYTVTGDISGNVKVTSFTNGVKANVSGDVKSSVKVIGTVGNNKDVDEGCVIEIAVPKAMVGLVGAESYFVRPELVNVDGTGIVHDSLTGVSSYSTKLWPEVKLDK